MFRSSTKASAQTTHTRLRVPSQLPGKLRLSGSLSIFLRLVQVSVKAGQGEQTRLYNDGQDHIFLTLSSEEKLRPPSVSGVFNLYGFCHELGIWPCIACCKNPPG